VTTDEFTRYDAAYVLGALSPPERREFENHLKGCVSCAISVAELAGLPGLMSRVSIDQLTAEAEPVPDTLLPSLARTVQSERERGRRRLFVGAAAVAAACLITVGTVALTRPDSPARPPTASSAASPSGTAKLALTAVVPSPVTASVRLVDVAWGTRIDLTCAYRAGARFPAGGAAYALVVIGRDGPAEQVGTWKSVPHRELTVVGATSQTRADITAVEIRTLDGRAILRLST